MELFAVLIALVVLVGLAGTCARAKPPRHRVYQRLASGDTLIHDGRGRIIANVAGRNPLNWGDE